MKKNTTAKMVDELKKQTQPRGDLNNQDLSKDPAQRQKQLAYQAQKSEQFQTLGVEEG